jgi:diguanylate cyclase (GGDEF)-like protein
LITFEEADRLREQLLAVLAEDARNADRLLARLDSITHETGISAHAAILLILTHLAFEDSQARQHWAAILDHRDRMTSSLGRDVGLRVALLDYFMNVNRRLVQPILIDLEMLEAGERLDGKDPLTGLVSERAFRTAVRAETRRARRYLQKVPVLLFDLDDFTGANETFGRLVADRFLKETAILLHNKVRDIDVVARPAEDEFALILPETDRNGALTVAERLRWEVEDHFSRREIDGRRVGLTISGGVACYPDDAHSPEELLGRAAQALYRAKAEGKNAVQAYRPERRRLLRLDLDPERFEIEVLGPRELGPARPRNLSRNGILFLCPEPIDVGERVEIRLSENRTVARSSPTVRVRGRVVRLEEIPEPEEGDGTDEREDRFEVGVAFDMDSAASDQDLLEFLEKVQASRSGDRP